MHEIAICETILKTVEKEAAKQGMKKVSRVSIQAGKMEAFDSHHMELALKSFRANPVMADIKFDITETDVELECLSCNARHIDKRFDDHEFAHQTAHAPAFYLPSPCPKCGGTSSKIIAGNEMKLISIE